MGYVYICGWGTKHPLNERCNCKYKYKCLDFQLTDWVEANVKGFKKGKWVNVEINHPSDITPKMQEEFLSKENI